MSRAFFFATALAGWIVVSLLSGIASDLGNTTQPPIRSSNGKNRNI